MRLAFASRALRSEVYEVSQRRSEPSQSAGIIKELLYFSLTCDIAGHFHGSSLDGLVDSAWASPALRLSHPEFSREERVIAFAGYPSKCRGRNTHCLVHWVVRAQAFSPACDIILDSEGLIQSQAKLLSFAAHAANGCTAAISYMD